MAVTRHFPNLNVADLKKKMDELNDMVGTSVKPGEKVDMEALSAKVEAKNDPVLTSAFEKVRSQVARLEGPVQQNDAPLSTNGHVAKNTFNMFLDAKKALAETDADGNGMIDRGEVLRSRLNSGPASTGKDLADASIFGANKEMEERVVAFLERNTIVATEISDRKNVYSSLKAQVKAAVPSERGQNAAMAHLQKILLQRGESNPSSYNGRRWVAAAPKDPKTPLEPAGALPHHSRMSSDDAKEIIKNTLKAAERNFLQRLFGSPNLSDSEVGKMVGTQDLEGYVASVDKEILTTQRASFEEIWLTGSDLIYSNYQGQDDKGSIWGFRLQTEMYAGTDVDPKTIHGIDGGIDDPNAEMPIRAVNSTAVVDVNSSMAALNERITPRGAAEIGTTFSIEIGGAKWFADFTKDSGPWFERRGGVAASGFKMDKPEKWMEIVKGDLNPTAAFMTGVLVVDGDMGVAMKMAGFLS